MFAASGSAPSPAYPAAPRSRRLALGVIATGMLMIILDGSIVTVAMPAIQNDLGFTPAGLSWVVNAYLIAFGSLLLLAGRLGDLIGRRRMFLAGTAVFTAASLLAGVATSPAVLIAARFLQGIGSAMASAVSLGILVTLFTEPRERAKAIAAFSFTGAAGASIGQVLGGALTDAPPVSTPASVSATSCWRASRSSSAPSLSSPASPCRPVMPSTSFRSCCSPRASASRCRR